jgi:hypothetical protein
MLRALKWAKANHEGIPATLMVPSRGLGKLALRRSENVLMRGRPLSLRFSASGVILSGFAGGEYLPLPASKGPAFPVLLTLDGYPTPPADFAQGQWSSSNYMGDCSTATRYDFPLRARFSSFSEISTPLSLQVDFNADATGSIALAMVLTADTLIIQPLYFLRIRNGQHGLIPLDFQDISAI